ncbi:hypothetical protein HPB52_005075 [Rhipicephalus sanguineus]|uniref:BACK domain-containing protein n=1 Tax=Rhipicephalus sanguineus TaxID=34632 RepID=A0A9D4SQ05_RHISA|nr:hypothetical protein HPB52_005075 [Rhipicephalus sanguineus]
MRTILEDDRLHAPNEVEDTFNALLKWIHADVAARKRYLAQFLPLLRLAWCSVPDFEKVITNPAINGDGDCLKVLDVIYQSTTRKFMAVGEVAGTDLSHKMWMRPRIPKDIIFVFGGWADGAISNMLTYNCRTEKWRDMGNQCTPSYHGMAVIGQRIYVLGGFNGCECHRTVVCFDVALGRWSYKAHMGRARCYGYIYAMGGFDGRSRTRTVERYSVKNDQWTNVANMKYMRSDASAAAACGRIYIAGGFTGRRFLETVECYDPSTKVWTLVKSMPWLSSGHKLVAHDDIIYIMGGSNNNGRISFVTQYDVRRDRYSDLPSMPYAKSNFAAVVLEGCIYTIGGFDGMNTVQQVERYDIAAQKWYTAPQINTKCSASAACVVRDIANPGWGR